MNTSISRVPTRILYKYFFTRIKIFRKKITFGGKKGSKKRKKKQEKINVPRRIEIYRYVVLFCKSI